MTRDIFDRKGWRQLYFWTLLLTFAGALYPLLFSPSTQTITVRLFINADKIGRFTAYWPDQQGGFSENNSRHVSYRAGDSGHEFRIPYYRAPVLLRLDPDNKQNRVTIRSISFRHNGKTVTLNPADVARYASAHKELSYREAGGGLFMELKGNDPQLILQGMPWPKISVFDWILIGGLFVGALALAFQFCRADGKSVSRFATVITALLTAGYWSGLISSEASYYLILLFVTGSSLALTAWVILLIRNAERDNWIWPTASTYLVLLLLGAILIPMMQTLTPGFAALWGKNVAAAWEKKSNTPLNDRLKVARDTLENTFVQKFHYASDLIHLNAETKVGLLGFSPNTKAILGKDGWFFEGYGDRRVEGETVRSFDNITDYLGLNPFSQKELEAWKIALEERYYWLKEQGIDYVFALAPTKALVYPEKLPERIYSAEKALDKPTRYDQLIEYLKKHSVVPVVDLRAALLAAKKKDIGYPLFYRTDFHWNYYGSFVAYRAIMDKIDQAYPALDLKPAALDEFRIEKITDWVHGPFMNMVGLDPLKHRNETYLTLFPDPASPYAEIKDFKNKGISDYSALPDARLKKYGNARVAVRKIDNPGGQLPMMIIIGDSFIEKTLGYFSAHAKHLLNFRAVTNFPSEPYATLKPSIVIQEILNMYILQPPPTNPPAVRAARIRALSNER